MLDRTEAAFLRSIAEDPEDNVARLVYADWLDEHGESPRSEFLRVQCELASPDLAEERRRALRLRERELLDAHRRQWIEAVGLPLEDVRFERGLITGARLSGWDGGRLLDAEHAPRLAPLIELDLSGLTLGTVGLTAFAEAAQLPALRKLIISDNMIFDPGVVALSLAQGLPRLDTVYLFQNQISDRDAARAALERAGHFRLTKLDLGERVEGYCMSRGEAEVARRHYVLMHLLPLVSGYFSTYERLRSALLVVAQYWDDEANDAVHGTLIVSELFEPMLEGAGSRESGGDANLPNTRIKREFGQEWSSEIGLWQTETDWDDNGLAIPLWAAFAPEGGSQDYGLEENYAPAVMFYRHGGYEFLPMCRPHLEGIRPERDWQEVAE
jgi:uncharacterized protein (TIGR02996 family)